MGIGLKQLPNPYLKIKRSVASRKPSIQHPAAVVRRYADAILLGMQRHKFKLLHNDVGHATYRTNNLVLH